VAAGVRDSTETDERMHLLDAWREAPVFSERERAALAWAEALTLITKGHVPNDVYKEARRHFSEKELVDLTVATVPRPARAFCCRRGTRPMPNVIADWPRRRE
jgi:alkylhydroperoxidase family enzyme